MFYIDRLALSLVTSNDALVPYRCIVDSQADSELAFLLSLTTTASLAQLYRISVLRKFQLVLTNTTTQPNTTYGYASYPLVDYVSGHVQDLHQFLPSRSCLNVQAPSYCEIRCTTLVVKYNYTHARPLRPEELRCQ